LTKREAEENLTVIQGTKFLYGIPMHVLVDPGSTHSFISYAWANTLEDKPEDLGCLMMIATPIGKTLETSKGYQGKEIQVDGRDFFVDLILMTLI